MKNWFNLSLDYRSVSLFRLALGLFISGQFLFMVFPSFTEIYSPDTGVLGNCFRESYAAAYNIPPFVFGITTDGGMVFFMAIITLSSFLFGLGFYPNILAFINCLLLWLFHSRYNPLYLGWEMYGTVLMTLAIFLPSRKYFSPFNYGENENKPNHFQSALGFAALFQVVVIYFYNGISKNGEKWMSGKAVIFFISEFDKARPAADWLLNHEVLCTFLSWLTLGIEIGLPLLVFSPYKKNFSRILASILILFLHWGIDFFVDVGNFKYPATCAAILILPTGFWSVFEKLIRYPIKAFHCWNFPIAKWKVKKPVEIIIAFSLITIILLSNLFNTSITHTNDRIKNILEKVYVTDALKSLRLVYLPQYSFFSQYWHLYSPDPPFEKGYLQVEIISSENDTFKVFRGENMGNKIFASSVQKYLYQYLFLKKNRNQKEQILTHCLLMQEIGLWNKKNRKKINKIEIVTYSCFPKNISELKEIKNNLKRNAVLWYDINYSKKN